MIVDKKTLDSLRNDCKASSASFSKRIVLPLIEKIEELQNQKDNQILDDQSITLREFFAAHAMQALIANPHITQLHGEIPSKFAIDTSEHAYEMADAMLRVRKE